MTSNDRPPSDPSDTAEKTRKLIRDFVETPPPKTMADVKAASDVYEANAKERDAEPESDKEKPGP